MTTFAAILPAAGRSTRFSSGRNKLFEDLAGRPVIVHSVQAFLRRGDVAAVIIPTADAAGLADVLQSSLGQLDARIRFCPGGATRAHSVRNGVQAVDTRIEWIAVHDAARPLISQGLIDHTLSVAVEHGAAVPALPVHLTIKQAQGPLPARVQRTIPRETLWAMQTPQIARRAALLAAFDACPIPLESVTDDVQLIELAGGEVWLVPGDERNLKITTAQDLQIAHALLTQISDKR
jgi:2-C-methyl-D-erythritol 4-phosphate cytidylyltransferase